MATPDVYKYEVIQGEGQIGWPKGGGRQANNTSMPANQKVNKADELTYLSGVTIKFCRFTSLPVTNLIYLPPLINILIYFDQGSILSSFHVPYFIEYNAHTSIVHT
jgi:hypothetical protein